VNIFIIFFYFSVLFTATASIFWFKFCYIRKLRYLLEGYNNKLTGCINYTIDQGIICILFGAAHSLLLERPQSQIFALILIEFIWVLCKIYALNSKVYDIKLR